MKRFTFYLPKDLYEWLSDNNSGNGVESVAAFVRLILNRFKKQETSQKWTDVDMKDWARAWHEHQVAGDNPAVLEAPEKKMARVFNDFKNSRS